MQQTLPRLKGFRFGVFEFDARQIELRKQGRRVRLRQQPLEVLAALLEHPDEIVTREELHRRLWPADTFLDFDHSLNNAVNRLREVLDDSSSHPQFIETIPRRGYRFVSSVEAIPDPVDSLPGLQAAAVGLGHGSRLHRRLGRWKIPLLAMLAVLAVGVAGYFARVTLLRRATAAPMQARIVVLPFQNLSGDSAEEYICDGLTEELIAQLSVLNPSRLAVIARTSAMHYKGTSETASQIGRELGVDYLLESSVRLSAGRLRITTQLIDTRTQAHLWTGNFDRNLGNVLEMDQAIAIATSHEIQLEVTTQFANSMQTPRRLNPQAHELYLRGRYAWNQRGIEDLRKAIGLFEQALAIDPAYAQAYSGLADSYALLTSGGGEPYLQGYPIAGTMAAKALQIDPSLAEAHASLAFVDAFYNWNFMQAEREFQRAIELDPSYVTSHEWYGLYLSSTGRHSEAIKELQLASKLDPVSIAIEQDLGDAYRRARLDQQAIDQYRKILEQDPNHAASHEWIALVYASEHKFPEAETEITLYKKMSQGSVSIVDIDADLAAAYANAGLRGRAKEILAELTKDSRNHGRPTPCVTQLYVALQENDKAMACLEQGFAAHVDWMIQLKTQPQLASLHSNPQFQDLLRRIGFTP
jgi:TolB-like protein/DNA-binding winged helix-turn-helix (wHTH) protein/Tfp pilus assembly protein PilF